MKPAKLIYWGGMNKWSQKIVDTIKRYANVLQLSQYEECVYMNIRSTRGALWRVDDVAEGCLIYPYWIMLLAHKDVT